MVASVLRRCAGVFFFLRAAAVRGLWQIEELSHVELRELALVAELRLALVGSSAPHEAYVPLVRGQIRHRYM